MALQHLRQATNQVRQMDIPDRQLPRLIQMVHKVVAIPEQEQRQDTHRDLQIIPIITRTITIIQDSPTGQITKAAPQAGLVLDQIQTLIDPDLVELDSDQVLKMDLITALALKEDLVLITVHMKEVITLLFLVNLI